MKTKISEGVIAQHVEERDMGTLVDESGATLGLIKVFRNGQVGLLWSNAMFTTLPLPDALREELVHLLRSHADHLEKRETDKRMKEVIGKMSREA